MPRSPQSLGRRRAEKKKKSMTGKKKMRKESDEEARSGLQFLGNVENSLAYIQSADSPTLKTLDLAMELYHVPMQEADLMERS